MNANNSMVQVVKIVSAPAFECASRCHVGCSEGRGHGTEGGFDVLPESLDQVKVLIRKHPILATRVVLAIGADYLVPADFSEPR